MLKKLYEDGFLLIEKILIQEYQRLNLTYQELVVLMFLFDFSKKRVFSSNALAKKTGISKNEVENILETLLSKGFFELLQETKGNKIIEVFSLNLTFQKIEQIYLEDFSKEKEVLEKTLIQETIDFIEQNKGQELVSYELDVIKNWYQKQEFSHKEIKEIIEEALHYKKTSVFYIDKLLHQKKIIQIEPDEKDEKILQKLFKKVK
ncbi:Putative DNA replication protein [Candidatus Phytoplasma australiense]|uniref:DNA Replication Protein DnaD n=2 Tax=Phytoplasma australiense TaxID=59748 RepID=R4RM01_PHYAS|nr:DnaD domain protein [Candidatus Phytoplasma australiense]AGL90360.1 DNA Replication Protein DnaD [Strawberry lethal yellows phytoplasma (CPA) str. NZSb11]CAM11964.1 Putative DNA replication protein [Candidatus Phytoplasma australiense]